MKDLRIDLRIVFAHQSAVRVLVIILIIIINIIIIIFIITHMDGVVLCPDPFFRTLLMTHDHAPYW